MRAVNRAFVILAIAVLSIAAIFLSARPRDDRAPIVRALDTLSSCFTRGPGAEDVMDRTCVDNTVTEILQSFSVHDIMTSINASTSPAVVERNCHAIGHLIGHKAYEQSTSLEGAFEQCTVSCRHSCMHGAVSEAVEKELGESYADEDLAHSNASVLLQIGKRYCDRGRLLCHAIGHLLRINLGEYAASLAACDRMGENKQMCYAGVFMEDASNIESLASGRPATPGLFSDYALPCTLVAAQYQSQCFRYLPMYQSNIFTERTIVSVDEQADISRRTCESLPRLQRSMCFYGMGAYANRLRDQEGNPVNETTYCDPFDTGEDRKACDIGIVRTILTSVPPAPERLFSYCGNMSDGKRAQDCYIAAFNIAETVNPKNTEVLSCNTPDASACKSAMRVYERERPKLPAYYYGPDGE